MRGRRWQRWPKDRIASLPMARFFWRARNWLGTCLSSCGGLDRTPQERKRLLGPGDNLPGAFHFVDLDEPMRVSGIRGRLCLAYCHAAS
jgi:hypothetical protein